MRMEGNKREDDMSQKLEELRNERGEIERETIRKLKG